MLGYLSAPSTGPFEGVGCPTLRFQPSRLRSIEANIPDGAHLESVSMSHLAKNLASSNSKLASVLNESKIDPIRLLSASHDIESLRAEDRDIKRAKSNAAGKDDEAAKAARSKKPRTGRPVTARLVTDVLAGKAVSGPAKNRILRAVNAVRAQKKLAAVELKQLF
jgi:hypothetical protein